MMNWIIASLALTQVRIYDISAAKWAHMPGSMRVFSLRGDRTHLTSPDFAAVRRFRLPTVHERAARY